MMFANTSYSPHTTAVPGGTALCPLCGLPVIAKCGLIVSWHWAHVRGGDCDSWSEPITAWHLSWQAHAPFERREVIRGRHRADILASDGTVVEVQHSTISADLIAEREDFYQRMTWIFDARDAYKTNRLNMRINRNPGKPAGYATFRWKHPRKSLTACRARVFLDLDGKQLFLLGKMYPNTPCGGWGRIVSASVIANWISG